MDPYKFWEQLPELLKKKLLPVYISINVLAAAFWLAITSEDKQQVVQRVFSQFYFQLSVLLVVAFLTITYARRISTQSIPAKRFKTAGIISTLCLEIGIFYYYQRQPEKITIHLYQFDTPNYDPEPLYNYVTEINKHDYVFKYVLHDEIDGFTLKRDTLGVQAVKVVSTLEQIANNNLALAEQDVAIAIIPYWLNEDIEHKWLFFSISPDTLHTQYNVASTHDWNFKSFQRVSVYDYLINTSMVITLCGSGGDDNPVILHEKGEARGCIFDYMAIRLNIVPTITNPAICLEHQTIIKHHFGSAYLRDALDILNMSRNKKSVIQAQVNP